MSAYRIAAILFALAGTLHAQRSPFPPDRLARVRAALDPMYRLDFATAEQRCRQMIADWPADPDGYVFLARLHWQQLLFEARALSVLYFARPDFFVARPPVASDYPRAAIERFQNSSRQAVRQVELAARKQPRDPATLYLTGVAYQNEAAFLLAIRRDWWQAFRAGSRSERAHRELLRLDSKYSDALLVTGLFHYTVGALPWGIRWIPVLLGYRGSKSGGEKELEQAASTASLVADDARALLAVLQSIDGRYTQAQRRLEELHARYPENHLTQLDIAGLLLLNGQPAQAAELYQRVIARLESSKAPSARAERAAALGQLGVAYRRAGRRIEAEETLRRTLNDPVLLPYNKAQTLLELGKTLDAAGRRAEARAQYNLVLPMREFPRARDEAARYLNRPYRE